MFEQEQDPGRCRELREIIRDIQSRRTIIVDQERSQRSQIKQLREEISNKRHLLEELAKSEIAMGHKPDATPGNNMIIQGSSVATAIQVANLDSQIRNLESQISGLEQSVSNIQDEMDRLLRSEGENARELSRLNCVAP